MIFVVTVYVIKIIIKQENTVTPLVNLPIRNMEGSSQPKVYSISKKIDNIQHKNQILLEDLEIKTPQGTDDKSNEEKVSKRLELIRRDEANPHIFYRSDSTPPRLLFYLPLKFLKTRIRHGILGHLGVGLGSYTLIYRRSLK